MRARSRGRPSGTRVEASASSLLLASVSTSAVQAFSKSEMGQLLLGIASVIASVALAVVAFTSIPAIVVSSVYLKKR